MKVKNLTYQVTVQDVQNSAVETSQVKYILGVDKPLIFLKDENNENHEEPSILMNENGMSWISHIDSSILNILNNQYNLIKQRIEDEPINWNIEFLEEEVIYGFNTIGIKLSTSESEGEIPSIVIESRVIKEPQSIAPITEEKLIDDFYKVLYPESIHKILNNSVMVSYSTLSEMNGEVIQKGEMSLLDIQDDEFDENYIQNQLSEYNTIDATDSQLQEIRKNQ